MSEGRMSARTERQAEVIPFRRGDGGLLAVSGLIQSVGADAWTVRPRDVVLLLPIIVPVIGAILLALLAWFVAWLAIVALLSAALVFADLTRRAIRRIATPTLRPLDREAISFQGR